MTTRRVFLRDYDEGELREMPEGALCDWLGLQATGETVDAGDTGHFICGANGLWLAVWPEGYADPVVDKESKFSRLWSAAGPLLERLMREHKADLHPTCDHGFPFAVSWWTGDVYAVKETISAPTPQLATCRAALVIARRKIEADGKGG